MIKFTRPRSYYARIGALGGVRGRGSLAKRLSAQNAARTRWARHRLRNPKSS